MIEKPTNFSESSAARTAKYIAYSLIGIYGVLLIAIGIVAAYKTGDDSKAWVDLLKSGFLILGGGLTSVIGYYFGSRGTQEAQEVAEITRKELQKQLNEFSKFKTQFAPTDDEDSLIEPDDPVLLEDEE